MQWEGQLPERAKAPNMLRSCALAFAMLLVALPAVASAQTTAGRGSVSSGGSPSGGTPWSAKDAEPTMGSSGGAGTPASASDAGDVTSAGAGEPVSGDGPLATMAQEPEPEPQPEGPGEEQPEEPGGEPQPPTGGDPVEVPAEQALATNGGGLPSTGLEVLKLALLGIVLVLVGARIRAIAVRRRAKTNLAPDGLPEATPAVSAVHADEAAPTGLVPSTATAKRMARINAEQ